MTKRISYHIIFWLSYVFFKAYLNFISSDVPGPTTPVFSIFLVMLFVQVVLLVVKLPVVYLLFGITDRFLDKRWSIIKSAGAALVVCITGTVLFTLINHFIVLKKIYNIQPDYSASFSFSSMLYSFFLLCFVAGVAMAIKLVRVNIRQKQAEQEMIKKKLETELRFLKSQTNPHFLFNTLNNIYALTRKKSDSAPEAVLKLSKLLRFMLYEAENTSIPIADELKVIDSYIELEKIRYNERLEVRYASKIDDATQHIAPLILLPFVENAFKHGASEARFNSYIHIDIKLEKGQLYFVIENSTSVTDKEETGKKIGLQNVRRQLELMYPEHVLIIDNTGDHFKVSLHINLRNHATL